LNYTRDQIRQLGHGDLLDEQDEQPSDADTVRFAVAGRPKPKANGVKAHRHQSADYERKVGVIARQATPCGWGKGGRYRLTVYVAYNDARVGDVTNVQKSVEDALEGILWENDRQVDDVRTVRQIDKELSGCAVGVTVERIDPPTVPEWVRLETEAV
jgi:Holliday junction resolvase RusA-like endonuclease